MNFPKKALISIVLILLLFSVGLVLAQGSGFTSIRGGVYLDVDGDGRCPERELPIPDVTIQFDNGSAPITLYTGPDGTYGLVAMGLGNWRVTANPDSPWRVTSTNPLFVEVSGSAGLVRTDVDFCVAREGTTITTSPAITGSTAVTGTNAEIAALAVQSEALLTNPPPPTPTPEPGAPPTAVDPEPPPPPAEDWLSYLNLFRGMADLPPFQEMASLSEGARSHARYMVVNDRPIAHNEDESNPYFSPGGRQAAINGNIFATSQIQANYVWGMNFWISAPFHLVPMLDTDLEFVGYGDYNQEIGTFNMAAVLDVRTELGNSNNEATYPIFFPGDGAETWVVRHSLYEWPDPLTSCPGYVRPVGTAIVLQLGDGSLTPNVTSHSISVNGQTLQSCIFDETSYTNPDQYAQDTGRIILNERDAIVIMPREPLAIDQTYTVEVTANGQTYNWSFSTRKNQPGQ